MSEWPFVLLFLFFFAGALARGQATYWLARILAEQGLKRTSRASLNRFRAWIEGDQVLRGRQIVHRWGPFAVAACYLTIGMQSLVVAAAGIMRMRWLRFTLAQCVGALAWATIYTTIGFAAWAALFALDFSDPVALTILVVGVLAIAAAVTLHIRGHRTRRTEPTDRKNSSTQPPMQGHTPD